MKIKNPYKKPMDFLQDHGHPKNYVETKKLHDRWETLPPLLKILHRLLLSLERSRKWLVYDKAKPKETERGTSDTDSSYAKV